jgi:division protein CdvB (Snf7/Vps24/ESCRT-III family)
MSDLQSNIKRINDKLQKLLKQFLQLQKDNDRQSKLIAELQQTKEINAQHIAKLQEQVDILKASAGKMTEAEKKSFEKHINQYIREIDKCIGLLED